MARNCQFLLLGTLLAGITSIHIITQIILPLWLVFAFVLLVDRPTIDVMITVSFKMAKSFGNLDSILRHWAKDNIQKSL